VQPLKSGSQTRRQLWFLVIAVAVVLIDQLAKNLVIALLQPNTYYPFIGDVVRLYLVYNDSAAFSLSFGSTAIFTVISTLAALAIVWYGRKFETTSWAVLAGFLLGGVVGNLVDRLIRKPGFGVGQVVDFISLPLNFAIFNIADMAIVITAAITVIRVMRGHRIGKA
jgi:signal peptidase II